MNKKLKLSMLAIGLGFINFNAFAASTGTITFVGEVTDTTCDVAVEGGSADSTVTMPTVSSSNLANVGDTAGRVEFDITLSSCSSAAQGAYAFFESGANVDSSTGRLTNTGSATNVDLQILDVANAYTPIKVGNTLQHSDSVATAISGDTARLNYAVEYYASGASTAGDVNSSVTYTISYK
ncbi:fimbrial protein [Vibrio alginolyticus]|uniref:fimbrial protein n=1 Tax=Vibrio alginolyticus TaxID=663 RepID=UPI003D7D1F06